jgi:hypothetical protein
MANAQEVQMKATYPALMLLSAAAAAAVPAIAFAQAPGNSPRDVQARMFNQLWRDTCATHFTSPEALRTAAASLGLRQDPPYAAKLLTTGDGTVWDASVGNLGQFAVVLMKDGTCKVVARRASSAAVVAVFEKAVEGVKRPGVSAERVTDRQFEERGAPFRQIAYFVSGTGANTGWSFVATLSDAEDVPAQATIAIGRTNKP